MMRRIELMKWRKEKKRFVMKRRTGERQREEERQRLVYNRRPDGGEAAVLPDSEADAVRVFYRRMP